ncbi:MAG: hypothetical protein QNJ11_08595 [Woeseiaceae bacterium]|nr:hypothetical protein [Woeseiaceae bacterium]
MNSIEKSWRGLIGFLILPAVLLGGSEVLAQQWVPPEKPEPGLIRNEADTDIEEGRLGLAALKYLWYHENALRYEPSLAGVRLSYALNDWRELADKYPPALQDMVLVRDRAEESVRLSDDDFSAFQDFVALNDVLDDDGRTIALFKWLDQNNRHFARSVYIVAQDALVDAGELPLCEKYIVGNNSFDSVLNAHDEYMQWMERRYDGKIDPRLIDAQQMILSRRVAYIVAILVNRGRTSEANEIASRVLDSLTDEQHRIQISDALEGIPPQRLR